jgi:hypothetical protein
VRLQGQDVPHLSPVIWSYFGTAASKSPGFCACRDFNHPRSFCCNTARIVLRCDLSLDDSQSRPETMQRFQKTDQQSKRGLSKIEDG